jgi:hypothetical protein
MRRQGLSRIGAVRVSRPAQDGASLHFAGPTWRVGVIKALHLTSAKLVRKSAAAVDRFDGLAEFAG